MHILGGALMCFYYDDERAACYTEDTRRARKPHVCAGCQRTIDVGHLYVYGHGVCDGSGFALKACGACHVEQRRIDQWEREVEGCDWPYSFPQLSDLSTFWRDHPEWVRTTQQDGQAKLLADYERERRQLAEYRALKTKREAAAPTPTKECDE